MSLSDPLAQGAPVVAASVDLSSPQAPSNLGPALAPSNEPPEIPLVAVVFLIAADPSPGLPPRLMQPFARRDLMPDRLWWQHENGTVQVEIACDAMPADVVHLVEGNLRARRRHPQRGARRPTLSVRWPEPPRRRPGGSRTFSGNGTKPPPRSASTPAGEPCRHNARARSASDAHLAAALAGCA